MSVSTVLPRKNAPRRLAARPCVERAAEPLADQVLGFPVSGSMPMHAEAAAHLAQTAALCAWVLKKIEIDDVYRQKASARA
jgi:hypothetical protein